MVWYLSGSRRESLDVVGAMTRVSRVGLSESQSSEGVEARQDDYRQTGPRGEVKEGSGLGVNERSIIIYETGHAGSQKAAGSTSPLSHITCVTRALPPPPLSRARFSLSQEMSVPPCPLSTLPALPLQVACPGWRLLGPTYLRFTPTQRCGSAHVLDVRQDCWM